MGSLTKTLLLKFVWYFCHILSLLLQQTTIKSQKQNPVKPADMNRNTSCLCLCILSVNLTSINTAAPPSGGFVLL